MVFDDLPKVGKGEKHRGSIVVRVDADHRQRGKRGVRGKDNGAAFIVEDPERRNAPLRYAEILVQPLGGGKAELGCAER